MGSQRTLPHVVLALLLAANLIVGAGCDKAKQAFNKAKAAKATVEKTADRANRAGRAADPERRALAAASKKMNAYAGCLNDFGRRIRESRRYYLRWADAKTGPSGKERNVYGLHQVSLDPKTRCADKVASVAKAEPSLPELEAAGDDFAREVVKAAKIINEAYRYYDQKDYKDDAFAKGKALHPKLMAAFDAFAKADTRLGQLYDAEDDRLAERRLAHIAKTDGKTMRYRHLVLMQRAKQLVRATDSASPMDLSDLEAAQVKSALDGFAAALRDASAYAKSHKKEFPTGSSYNWVGRRADDFLKAAKALHRRKRDGKTFTGKESELRFGNADRLEGHPAHVTAKYNDLVRDSNSLRL